MKKNRRNLYLYVIMLVFFGELIYWALKEGEKFDHLKTISTFIKLSPFRMFLHAISDNFNSSITLLLIQIIVILLACRFFSFIFKYIGQPGVIGEIVAGIFLGPSFLGQFFPQIFGILFRPDSLINVHILSQIGLILFMFVIGLEVDFSLLKNKINETLIISHAGILFPFFLGILSSYWVYENYASQLTSFLPFALFIGISMSITAFPVLARIIQERGMTHSPVGVLSIASAANDDVTAWCLLAVVIAVAKAGSFASSLFSVTLTLLYILFMFFVARPFFQKIGRGYVNKEVINKTFVSFIFLVLIISATLTEIIGIHALFGAFIAGVVMPSNLGFRRVMMEKVEDVTLAFFLPLFFAYTGLNTNLLLINTPQMWIVCGLFILVAVTGKFGGCAIAARLVGESKHDSLIIGTLMNTRGLMELIALNIGYEMGVLPKSIFAILVIMALVTTFMTTPALDLFQWLFPQKNPKKEIRSHVPKLMLSFGRPESGKNLLSIYNLLFGSELKEKQIIASHFTMGTDLNLVSAEHFFKDSFSFINKEATNLDVEVDKRYKLTNNIVDEILKIAQKEEVDYLLLGAGYKLSDIKPVSHKHQSSPYFSSLLNCLREKSFSLPGILMTEKDEEILKRLKCTVMILINHRYTNISRVSIIVDNVDDFTFLSFLPGILQKANRVSIFQLKKLNKDPNMQIEMDDILAEFPDKVGLHKYNELSELSFNNQKDHLIISNYNVCKLMTKMNNYSFNTFPSYLAIRQKLL